jgi:hypothetical protein
MASMEITYCTVHDLLTAQSCHMSGHGVKSSEQAERKAKIII